MDDNHISRKISKKISKKISSFSAHLYLVSVLVANFSLLLLATNNPNFLTNYIKVQAQSQTNSIGLRINKVEKNGQNLDATLVSQNNWRFDGVLNDSDAIKYQWTGVDLQVKFRNTPASSGGFLKVYLNDDQSEDNFIVDSGADDYPLRIEKLKSRLAVGQNKLMFVYIDDKLRPANPPTKVVFSFNYKEGTAEPKLAINKPASGEIFVEGAKREIEVEVSNFNLSQELTDEVGVGKLNIFYKPKDKPETLLTSLPNGLEKITRLDASRVVLSISSENISKLNELSDSTDGELLFRLQNKQKDNLAGQKVGIKVNYNNTLDVGLPRLEFVDPSPNNKDVEVNGNLNFLLKTSNFKLLDEAPIGNPSGNQPLNQSGNENGDQGTDQNGGLNSGQTGNASAQPGEGYLQIFINDKPIQTFWSKTQFSLNEIGYTQNVPAKLNIKVQLVDTNFVRLSPEAKSEVMVSFVPEVKSVTQTSTVQSSNWRVIVIAIIVFVIVAGTAFLIARG